MSRLLRDKCKRTERGIALLMVLSTIALVLIVVVDFQYNSRLDYERAIGARDELQAEYNALSALRMRALLLKQSKDIDKGMRTVFGAMGGDSSAMPPIAQILEMIPVECGVMSAVIRKVDAAVDGGGSDAGFFAGDCLATSQSEHSKIALNLLANNTLNRGPRIGQLLMGMMTDRKMERHFQDEDANGMKAESPAELVGAMVDWVDRDYDQEINDVAPEDRNYVRLDDDYKSKNAPFDSVDELQLVHGVDDELFNLLKGHVTIYSDSEQIDLATAPLDRVVLGLCASLPEGVDCGYLIATPTFRDFYWTVVEMRDLGGAAFAPLKVATLAALAQQFGLDSVLDLARLKQVFTDDPSTTWYTVEAQGRVGNATRRMRTVFQTEEGRFYYYRVE